MKNVRNPGYLEDSGAVRLHSSPEAEYNACFANVLYTRTTESLYIVNGQCSVRSSPVI